MSPFWRWDKIRSPNLLINSWHRMVLCVWRYVYESIPWGHNCSNDLLNVKWTVVGRKHHAGPLAGSSLPFHALIVRQLLWSVHSTEGVAYPEKQSPRSKRAHTWASYSPLSMETEIDTSSLRWAASYSWCFTPHTKWGALSRHWQIWSRKAHKPYMQ